MGSKLLGALLVLGVILGMSLMTVDGTLSASSTPGGEHDEHGSDPPVPPATEHDEHDEHDPQCPFVSCLTQDGYEECIACQGCWCDPRTDWCTAGP